MENVAKEAPVSSPSAPGATAQERGRVSRLEGWWMMSPPTTHNQAQKSRVCRPLYDRGPMCVDAGGFPKDQPSSKIRSCVEIVE
jgi:hypothetical protein